MTTASRRWTCTETVDVHRAVIRVHGRVDRAGADLLRGTIRALQRQGHRSVTLVLPEATDVTQDASAVLAGVADELADGHAQLIITDRSPQVGRR
ncbi:STAS domain-containing protein [Geodermatophilus marinus]|uniref:hypothetical protein n=1 Tax=Geodermatophilus sp. LHW52908 TaxID=2303986 RepID=UPI0011C0EC24|nr:hypothetical protein [Geodermatophilus sp. LHW52908]